MFAATTGTREPEPSAVLRSTSNREVNDEWRGTRKTSS